jgi:hypothetical protein
MRRIRCSRERDGWLFGEKREDGGEERGEVDFLCCKNGPVFVSVGLVA